MADLGHFCAETLTKWSQAMIPQGLHPWLGSSRGARSPNNWARSTGWSKQKSYLGQQSKMIVLQSTYWECLMVLFKKCCKAANCARTVTDPKVACRLPGGQTFVRVIQKLNWCWMPVEDHQAVGKDWRQVDRLGSQSWKKPPPCQTLLSCFRTFKHWR